MMNHARRCLFLLLLTAGALAGCAGNPNGVRPVIGIDGTVMNVQDPVENGRALVMTGSPTHPTGVFRGQAGHLIVTSATDNVIRGRFQVDAVGFLASDPADETRPMKATGMFTAIRK